MARDFQKDVNEFMSLGVGAIGPLIEGAAAVSYTAIVTFDSFGGGNVDDRIFSFFVDSGNSILLSTSESGGNTFLTVAGRSQAADSAQITTGVTTQLATGTEYVLGGVLDFGGDANRGYINGVEEMEATGLDYGSTTGYTHGSPTKEDMIGADDEAPNTGDQVNGRISECAIWNVDIGVDGFLQLADRYSPEMVRPDSLIAYWRLDGNTSPEPELINGKVGTITGTLIVKAVHPRMIYPHSRSIFVPVVAGGVNRSQGPLGRVLSGALGGPI